MVFVTHVSSTETVWISGAVIWPSSSIATNLMKGSKRLVADGDAE
jgi:hypothetical protein